MSCILPPSCSFCVHYLGEDKSTDKECLAFKDIPDNIIKGFDDHTKPHEGDNGFQFVLNEAFKDDFEDVKQMKQVLNHYTNNEQKPKLEKPESTFTAWDAI